MTIDDSSSIYVGGLPYDVTEEGLRRVFYVYGAVIAVKIINDRSIGGKCYGFVTFANPRSAIQAIKEMDGKTISGRVVRVNDVRTRGGRPNFNREVRDSSRHDMDRRINSDRVRDHRKNDNYDRHYHQEGHRERSQDHDQSRERGHDHTSDRYVDEEKMQDYSRHVDDVEQELGRKRERDWERDGEKNIEQQRNIVHHKGGDKDNQQQVHLLKRSRFDDHGSRELSLESFDDDDDQDQGEHNLEVANHKLEELRKEISQIEELVAGKQDDVSKLQEKCQKLEDSLIAAKKLTSRHRIQLAKLHKSYLQMRDYEERCKKSEQELQWLIDSTTIELGNDGGGVGDGIVANGRA